MTNLTETERATYQGFINEYLEQFAPAEINAERFRSSLAVRESRVAKHGFKPTDVLYGPNNEDFVVYFSNPETGYVIRAEWKGTTYGVFTYEVGHYDDKKGELITGSLTAALKFAGRDEIEIYALYAYDSVHEFQTNPKSYHSAIYHKRIEDLPVGGFAIQDGSSFEVTLKITVPVDDTRARMAGVNDG